MSDAVGDSLLRLIEAHAARNPGAPAVLAPGRRPLTYGVLDRHVANVGDGDLERMGRRSREIIEPWNAGRAAASILEAARGAAGG